MIGSKVTAILLEGEFCLLVESHREGSAPAACAAGLFYGSFVCDLSLGWFVSSSISSPQFLPSEWSGGVEFSEGEGGMAVDWWRIKQPRGSGVVYPPMPESHQ